MVSDVTPDSKVWSLVSVRGLYMIMPLVDFRGTWDWLFRGEEQSGLQASFIKVLTISYLPTLCAARAAVHMNQGGSGFFCGLSLGLRQTWRLKECKRQTSHLVEREALATPVKTCSFRTKRNGAETGDTTLQHRAGGTCWGREPGVGLHHTLPICPAAWALPLTCCVTLNKSLFFLGPESPYL